MRLKNIQALRAIAALMVVTAHLIPTEQKCIPGATPFLEGLDPVGFTGVDLFFVISGFVIITSTWSSFGKTGIGLNFILRRAARIFPLYWIVLVPIAGLDILVPSWVNSSQEIRPDILASFALLPQPGIPLLTVSWSLVYEMYFYYIYAFAIQRPIGELPWLIGSWIAFTAAIATLAPHTKPYLSQLGNTITYEFALGMFIGWLFACKREPKACFTAIGLGICIVAANTLLYHVYGDQLRGPFRFAIVGIPMALIVYGFVGLEVKGTFTFGSLLVLLGDASYSMYLWHVPILDVIVRLSMLRSFLRAPIIHCAWLCTCIALVIVLSVILYWVIEKPIVRAFGLLFRLRSPGTILPNVSPV